MTTRNPKPGASHPTVSRIASGSWLATAGGVKRDTRPPVPAEVA